MPIPFIIAGLGAAVGVGNHLSAKKKNEMAQEICREAERKYRNEELKLKEATKKTDEALTNLGTTKKQIIDTSLKQFVNVFKKIKTIQETKTVLKDETIYSIIEKPEMVETIKMINIYSSALKSGSAGVATGTMIALAASGTIEGIAVESTLAAGGATFFASAASVSPLAMFAVPVIMFTGFSANRQADENLGNANMKDAEVDKAIEKMKTSELLSNKITDKANMFNELLCELNKMFSECVIKLSIIIKKKEKQLKREKNVVKIFSKEEIDLMAVTGSLATTIKKVIVTQMLSTEGGLNENAETMYEETVIQLQGYEQKVDLVSCNDYGISSDEIEREKMMSSQNSIPINIRGICISRNVLAIILGIVFANILDSPISYHISSWPNKFLFMETYTANKLAVWILVFTSILMLLGKFKTILVELGCEIMAGIGIFILYVQYCRTVEMMNHYIIFSVVLLGICVWAVANMYGDSRRIEYFSRVCTCCAGGLFMFLIYMFLSNFVWFSNTIFLVLTSLIMLGYSEVTMLGMEDIL